MRAGVFFGPGDDVLVLSCAGEADGRKDVGEGSTSVGTDGCLCAFKLGGGSALATLTPCHAPPGGLALLGDDHVLAAQLPRIKRERGGAVGGGSVHCWAWQQNVLPRHRSFPPEAVNALAASPSGALIAAGGSSGRLYLWDASSGELLRTWNAHYKAVDCVAFVADGSVLASGGRDALTQAWALSDASERSSPASHTRQPLRVWSGHTLAVTALWGGAGGQTLLVASASLDRSVRLWSLAADECLKALSFPCALHSLVVDPGECLLYAGGADGKVYEVPLAASARGGTTVDEHVHEAALVGHSAAVSAVAFTPDGVGLVTASLDGTAILWNVLSRQAVRTFSPQRGPIAAAQVIPPLSCLSRGSVSANSQAAVPPLEKYTGVRRGAYSQWETAPIKLRRLAETVEKHAGAYATSSNGDGSRDSHTDREGASRDSEGIDVSTALFAAQELQEARAEAARWAKLHAELAAAVASGE